MNSSLIVLSCLVMFVAATMAFPGPPQEVPSELEARVRAYGGAPAQIEPKDGNIENAKVKRDLFPYYYPISKYIYSYPLSYNYPLYRTYNQYYPYVL